MKMTSVYQLFITYLHVNEEKKRSWIKLQIDETPFENEEDDTVEKIEKTETDWSVSMFSTKVN